MPPKTRPVSVRPKGWPPLALEQHGNNTLRADYAPIALAGRARSPLEPRAASDCSGCGVADHAGHTPAPSGLSFTPSCCLALHWLAPAPRARLQPPNPPTSKEDTVKQPENQSKTYAALFSAIDEGKIKVPQFQRDFVWSKQQTARLIDSILKGFPIGTFILWTTRTRLRHMRDIGNMPLREPRDGDAVQYVLDGQQRITSLYAVRKGVRLTRYSIEIDYKDIVIDLAADPDGEEEVVLDSGLGDNCVTVYELLNAPMKRLAKDYHEYIDAISDYKQKLEQYHFSTVVIDEYPIDVACDVFTRINTGGQTLTLFEIMVAKTFRQDHFDLAERFQELISSESERDLESVGYDTVSSETVLQCVSAVACGSVRRQDILKISREDFIGSWETTKDGLFQAVDYLRSHLGVRVSGILPYPALLIPFTWFFAKKGGASVSQPENRLLRQYFYWASLTNRFGSSVGSKVAEDIGRMKSIIGGRQPHYDQQELAVQSDDLVWRVFSAGDAYTKAVVCLLSERDPRRLNTNGKVELDNKWLKQANSKNYHHFFPRAFLRDQGYELSESNSIMNIVLVDDHTNKQVIGAKPPSKYIAKFADENRRDLARTLRTHFIKLDWGVMEDDYETFVTKRAKAVAKALNKVLDPEVPEEWSGPARRSSGSKERHEEDRGPTSKKS